MKTLTTLAVLAAAFVSVAVQAQGGTPTGRDAVSAELQRARSAGELDHARRDLDGPAAAPLRGASPAMATGALPASRIAVQAELARARANGELDWASAELQGAQRPARAGTSVAAR
jgi:hypothetical protein